MDPLTTLRKPFGHTAFRLHQEAIVRAVLDGRDVFVLMPTGGGKSLCYQLPALLRDGITIVVSPLIALMKDQVDGLRQLGIEAAFLNSLQTPAEQEAVMDRACSHRLKLLYLAPERLLGNDMNLLHRLASCRISLIAVDEAHCISHWGHDFRPEYRMLSNVKTSFPHIPLIALTATADELTRQDIIDKLALANPAVFVSSFNREKIRYCVQPRRVNVFRQLLDFLREHRNESGIIYCLSRRSTEELAAKLNERGIAALPYHAGMDRHTRAQHQEEFLQGRTNIIVATIAFGMGIDKSDVRFVVHIDLPKNIESYYQETGRAGRDGNDATALLFYDRNDVAKLKRFAMIQDNITQTEIQLRKLDQMDQYGSLKSCRRKYLLNYFGEETVEYCGNCDVCLTEGPLFDVTLLCRKLFAAIQTVGQGFGMNYVVDFLRGTNENKLRVIHRASEAFGSGVGISRSAWGRLVLELIESNYLQYSRKEYRVLRLTQKAAAVLDGTAPIQLERNKEVSAEWSELQGKRLPHERELLEALVERRTELLLEGKKLVPPGQALLDMATFLPQTTRELVDIAGLGNARIAQCGKAFLTVIRGYCAKRRLTSRMAMMPGHKSQRLRYDRERQLLQQSQTLFRLGYTVDEIAELRKISREAVASHLEQFSQVREELVSWSSGQVV